MKRQYFRRPERIKSKGKRWRRLRGLALTPFYWGFALKAGAPGLFIHRKAAALGAKLLFLWRLPFRDAYGLMFHPMDSFRYFELGTLWEYLGSGGRDVFRYLDVSSPRLFPVLFLDEMKGVVAEIVNPDGKDLEATVRMMAAAGLSDRCRFHAKVVHDLDFPPGTFDLITSISAIEHIPGGEDFRAVERLWGFLKPGGRMLITVPCAREAFEEYMDFNEYGILVPDESGHVFGSTCYDSRMLEERFFSVAGEPRRMAVFGEKVAGAFFRNRSSKLSDPDYPFWQEPYMMGRDYGRFRSVGELPGLGVVAMEFLKW